MDTEVTEELKHVLQERAMMAHLAHAISDLMLSIADDDKFEKADCLRELESMYHYVRNTVNALQIGF